MTIKIAIVSEFILNGFFQMKKMTMDTSTPLHIFFSLITLTFLELVLGVDNLVFLAIASSQLRPHQQKIARRLGLIFALVTRLLLLASVVWLAKLRKPVLTLFSQPFSVRDLFLIGGGLFLLVKATQEIHREMEPYQLPKRHKRTYASVTGVVMQIGILDIIFSLDSVLTAVGLTTVYWIMATAIVIAILAMIFLSEPLSALVRDHPTIKMLALSFLLLIGVVLIADGFHYHIPREYIYFSICFSVVVEALNSFVRRKERKK
jgi:predicted tellurium resistance membrane protein TerC